MLTFKMLPFEQNEQHPRRRQRDYPRFSAAVPSCQRVVDTTKHCSFLAVSEWPLAGSTVCYGDMCSLLYWPNQQQSYSHTNYCYSDQCYRRSLLKNRKATSAQPADSLPVIVGPSIAYDSHSDSTPDLSEIQMSIHIHNS